MAIGTAIRRVRTLFDTGTMGGLTDAQLLERFATRNGEAAELAFAAIVERHGPMVIRVCRGVLDDPDDAHDAFQATFLVLVTKVGSVRSRDSLGSWLYGVALRVSRFAKAARGRRQAHERRHAAMSVAVVEPSGLDEIGPVVRDEFARLPDRYRVPMTLCDLDDLTHEEAARQLGWPVGTIKSRLSRGRARLRERLIRRGLGAVPIILARPPALPASLIDRTARTAMKLAANGRAVGTVPAAVEALLQGVRRMMIRDMIKNGAIGALAFGLLAAGAAIAADRPVDPEVKPAKVTTERLVSTEVRFIEMKGIDWTDGLKTKLKPVNTKPGFKVWTSEVGVVDDLRKSMKNEVQAPRVSTAEGALATIDNSVKRYFVADAVWEPGPERSGFRPVVGNLFDGVKVQITGRKIAQGMLVRVNIDDQRLLGYTRGTVHSPIKDPGFTEITEFRIDNQRFRSDNTYIAPAPIKRPGFAASIQIPQTTKLQQEGEWLIPNGGMLILSTGSHHVEPPRRKTNVWLVDVLLDELGVTAWLAERDYWSSPVVERLVVIDAKSMVLEPEAPVTTSAVSRP
jgi:RNA polymerase sigma factor (sigma-70 family)